MPQGASPSPVAVPHESAAGSEDHAYRMPDSSRLLPPGEDAEFTRTGSRCSTATARAHGAPRSETVAARAAAGLAPGRTRRRNDAPREAPRTLDPGAIDALAARLPQGSALVSATNGKTTTTAMVARILGDRTRGSPGTAPARTSSRASPPRSSRGARAARLFEVDEAALPGGSHAVCARGRSCSETSSATSSTATGLEHVAEGWRNAVAGLSGTRSSSSVATTRSSPTCAAPLQGARSSTGSTTRRSRARPSSTRPTRSTASAAERHTPTTPLTSAISATTAAPRARARPSGPLSTSRPAGSEPDRLRGLVRPRDGRRGDSGDAPLPGLYNVYNAVAAGALAQALGATLDEIRAGLEGSAQRSGVFERIPAGDKTLLVLLVKEPGRARTSDPHARGRARRACC